MLTNSNFDLTSTKLVIYAKYQSNTQDFIILYGAILFAITQLKSVSISANRLAIRTLCVELIGTVKVCVFVVCCLSWPTGREQKWAHLWWPQNLTKRCACVLTSLVCDLIKAKAKLDVVRSSTVLTVYSISSQHGFCLFSSIGSRFTYMLQMVHWVCLTSDSIRVLEYIINFLQWCIHLLCQSVSYKPLCLLFCLLA